MPRSQRPTVAPSTSAAAEESSPLSDHQEVIPDWLVGNDANNNGKQKKNSSRRSHSFISRARSGADSLSAVETDCDGEISGSSQREARKSPGKNQRRRRSLSLGRRRSRSRSRSRSYSTNDRPSDEYGHYAPTPTKNDDDEDDDGFDDEDPNGMQVMNELGLPTNILPNDDSLVEDDYDPSKHGPGDDFSFSCGTCQSDVEPPIFFQFMQYMVEETKELCTTICGGNGHVHEVDDESKTLATNEVPLKEEMSRPGAHMRHNQSRTLVGSDPMAQAGQFNPYGDDDTKEKVPRKGLRGMRRSRSRTRTLPSRRSKSMERKLAKWKSAKSKMQNKEMEYASAEASADPTDWRTVCDDVLSTREEGHFVAYEAGRVRSSTKHSNERTGQDGMERFLYM